jgi:hypothetical protein
VNDNAGSLLVFQCIALAIIDCWSVLIAFPHAKSSYDFCPTQEKTLNSVP